MKRRTDRAAVRWVVVVALIVVISATGVSTVRALSVVTAATIRASPAGGSVASSSQGASVAPERATGCAKGSCPSTSLGRSEPATSTAFWTNIGSQPSPVWTYDAAMTYDPATQSDLLFGVNASGGTQGNGTWSFAAGRWTDLTGTVGPAPPYQTGPAMVYDAHDGYVLLFGCTIDGEGGEGSTPCNDTWEFSAGAWHWIDAVDPPTYGNVTSPEGQAYPLSLAYDAAGSNVLLTDGFDTWNYSDGIWTPVCVVAGCATGFVPGPDLDGRATYDAADGYVVFVGDRFNASADTYSGSWTWKFSGGAWANISASVGTQPPALANAAFAYDSTTSAATLFGGVGSSDAYQNQTWSFSEGEWSNLSGTSAPSPRAYAALADDPADASLVLFSGLSPAGPENETWVWSTSPPIGSLTISVAPASPTPGRLADLRSTVTGGVGPFGYAWNFGDGSWSSAADPTHAWAQDGTYSIELWVNDSVDHTSYASTRVVVYAPLALESLVAAPDPAVLGQPVTFTAVAANGTPPYTFAWSFGDGGTGGNLSSITHVYTTDGPFEAEVTVSDAVLSQVDGFVNVSIQLEALAGSSSTSGASPLAVEFVGQAQGGTPPYAYNWTFGDGGTSSLQNPQHTYLDPGRYSVVLTVRDSRGNRSTSSLTVEVTGPTTGGPSVSGWFDAFLAALAATLVLASIWAATWVHRRRERREADEWMDELMGPPGGPGQPPDGAP